MERISRLRDIQWAECFQLWAAARVSVPFQISFFAFIYEYFFPARVKKEDTHASTPFIFTAIWELFISAFRHNSHPSMWVCKGMPYDIDTGNSIIFMFSFALVKMWVSRLFSVFCQTAGCWTRQCSANKVNGFRRTMADSIIKIAVRTIAAMW